MSLPYLFQAEKHAGVISDRKTMQNNNFPFGFFDVSHAFNRWKTQVNLYPKFADKYKDILDLFLTMTKPLVTFTGSKTVLRVIPFDYMFFRSNHDALSGIYERDRTWNHVPLTHLLVSGFPAESESKFAEEVLKSDPTAFTFVCAHKSYCASPLYYEKVSEISGISLFRPVAPEGFVSVGVCAFKGTADQLMQRQESLGVWCIRQEFVSVASVSPQQFWAAPPTTPGDRAQFWKLSIENNLFSVTERQTDSPGTGVELVTFRKAFNSCTKTFSKTYKPFVPKSAPCVEMSKQLCALYPDQDICGKCEGKTGYISQACLEDLDDEILQETPDHEFDWDSNANLKPEDYVPDIPDDAVPPAPVEVTIEDIIKPPSPKPTPQPAPQPTQPNPDVISPVPQPAPQPSPVKQPAPQSISSPIPLMEGFSLPVAFIGVAVVFVFFLMLRRK